MKTTIALTALLFAAAVNATASDAISTSIETAERPAPATKELGLATVAETGKIVIAQLVDIARLNRQLLQLAYDKREADANHECLYNDHVYTNGSVVEMEGQKKMCAPQRPIVNGVTHLVWQAVDSVR